MLKITIPEREWYDEDKNEFFHTKEAKLQMEHSLISVSKWESKWKKSFLDSKASLTADAMIDYFRCMVVSPPNIDPIIFQGITQDLYDEIVRYINDPMTAVKFYEDKDGPKSSIKDTVTSDLIYYWMIANQIPPEYEKWHLNRLMTLIRICGMKQAPNKTMSKAELARRNRALNASRRAQLHSKG